VAICTNFADYIDELLLELGKDHSMQTCKVDPPFVSLKITYLTICVRQIVNPFWISNQQYRPDQNIEPEYLDY
jgi:hypothetical protein